jgi:hypothetical protein
MNEPIRDTILEAIEAALEAQLSAVRRLRKKEPQDPSPKPKKGMSQVDMVADILLEAGRPLHLKEIVERVERKFSLRPDPDSLVSALTKRVVKKDRFVRTGPNTFGLLEARNAR